MNEYQVTIAINDKAMLHIIEKNFPSEAIILDDSCFYGVVDFISKAKDKKTLLSNFYKLQIYEEDFVQIKKLDKFYTEEDYYLNNDGSQVLETRMGFEWQDFFITEPFSSECGRFEVDPTKYYGITKDEADKIEKYNTIRGKKQ